MKELTAAQGLLRCGECDTIFDAMKALSTTLPEERVFAEHDLAEEGGRKPLDTRIRVLPDNQPGWQSQPSANTSAANKVGKSASGSRKFLWMSLVALGVLLILQLLYSSRGWLHEYPALASVVRSVCESTGLDCAVPVPSDLSKIEVLSRSAYSHPNLPESLIISSSIQNNAEFKQPYPTLEIRFLDRASKVVAMRRFKPADYMDPADSGQLMESGVPHDFSVNIADPGPEAVEFEVRFL